MAYGLPDAVVLAFFCLSCVCVTQQEDNVLCEFERVDLSQDDALQRFAELRKSHPVVLTHGIDDWAAFSEWGWNSLQARVGDMRLTTEDVHPGVLGDGWEEGMTLSATMEAFSSKPRLLLLKPQSSIVQALKEDFNIPAVLEGVQRYGPQFSIGGKDQGAVFNAHQENWLAQVFGRKLWMVYPPSIFGAPDYAETSHPCQYLEMESRLDASQRRLRSCIIHPNEILFLPERWPHSTCNLDSYTVGVGYFGALGNMSKLEQAAVRGSWHEIETELPTSNDTLRSLLELAAEAGHGSVTQGLLSRGAEATGTDLKGRSALHAAAKTGWPETVSLLLHARALSYEKDVDGNLPLLEASYAGHLGVVQALCRCETKNGTETKRPCPAARECATTSSTCKRCKYESVLEAAASGGHLSVANFLFEEGGIAERLDQHDLDAPLVRAAGGGHTALIDFFCKYGADVNTRTSGGKPPISWSAKNGHEAAIKRLVENGANISQESLDGKSALIEAIRRRHNGVVRFLLQYDVLTEVLDRHNRTPLYHAANTGQSTMVELLLNARATIDAEDMYGTTVVDEAARVGQHDVLSQLLVASGKHAQGLASKALRFLESDPNAPGASDSQVRQVLQQVLAERDEL